MPYNDDYFSDRGFQNISEVESLEKFTKNLEKHFFSQVTIRNGSSVNNGINLVIELDCNFGLLETLHHFNKDTWGNFSCNRNSFKGAFNQLNQNSELQIDVEEFSIFLKDTSIIVNRIYEQSVSEQLENILIKLSEHAIHFTKGFTEIPYEIYVPVFEDNLLENEHTLLMNIKSGNTKEQDYFSFWGLYNNSEDDAVVYDLKNETIIKGDLQMLNR
jgi:hypothetical protein